MSLAIQIVDENDKPLYAASQEAAYASGLLHRIVRVMITDENDNMLLQKRSSEKRTYPNCWDNSAAGHVDAGETYEVAAYRELKEELGISGYQLREIDYFKTTSHYKDHAMYRFVKVYRLELPHATKFTLQTEEVSDVRWVSRDELAELISKHPEGVSDGLIEVYERMYG